MVTSKMSKMKPNLTVLWMERLAYDNVDEGDGSGDAVEWWWLAEGSLAEGVSVRLKGEGGESEGSRKREGDFDGGIAEVERRSAWGVGRRVRSFERERLRVAWKK